MKKKWLFGRFYSLRRQNEQYLETIEENVQESSSTEEETANVDSIIENFEGQQKKIMQPKNSWVHIGGTIIASIFQAIVLYVLIHSRNVSDVCGDGLWIWIMSRFHLFFIEVGFALYLLKTVPFLGDCYYSIILCYYSLRKRGRWTFALMSVVFAIHNVLFGLTLWVIWSAIQRGGCYSSLSNNTIAFFNGIPILEIIGFIYMILDIIFFLSFFIVIVILIIFHNQESLLNCDTSDNIIDEYEMAMNA
jgi:hypothetical protein